MNEILQHAVTSIDIGINKYLWSRPVCVVFFNYCLRSFVMNVARAIADCTLPQSSRIELNWLLCHTDTYKTLLDSKRSLLTAFRCHLLWHHEQICENRRFAICLCASKNVFTAVVKLLIGITEKKYWKACCNSDNTVRKLSSLTYSVSLLMKIWLDFAKRE